MRRSICYCKPHLALAGEVNTWTFIYTPATNLPKGTLLRFDLVNDGREIDWEVPTSNLKKNANVIYAQLENGKILESKEIEIPDSFLPQYEFTLSEKLEAGSTFTIIMGSSKLQEKWVRKHGTRSQTYSQRRRPFLLYVDTTGKGHFEEPEVFSIDIRGNSLSTIKVLTPSFATRNKRFDITVRFEDEYANLTNNAPEDTLIELTYEHLRENLKWKIFVPETGFISLPNLYFNEIGIYTIQLTNAKTRETFCSPPIKCFNENDRNLFWGLLHGESIRVDSTENIESCLRHFRDEKSLNFFSSSSFEDIEETPDEIWKLICQNIVEFDEPDRFVALNGFQWSGNAKTEGLRQFIYPKDNKPILRKNDNKSSSLKKIYKSASPKEFISIPSFTMGKGADYDFKYFQPEFERVVEIYNSWGSSERTEKEGNPRPIKGPARSGVQETAEGSIVRALLNNKRFGFVAGGLDDRGVFSGFFEGEQEQYSPGITAIIAPEHTRTALYEALYNRSCYATTGERIILGLYLAGVPMGTETNTIDKHGLMVNRHLSGYVAGTTTLQTVEIIRNGEVIHTFQPDHYHFDYTYDDMTPLSDVAIDAKDKRPPFVFYYLRVTQKDGHMAWSSPIWVDYYPGKPKKGKDIEKNAGEVLENEPDDSLDKEEAS